MRESAAKEIKRNISKTEGGYSTNPLSLLSQFKTADKPEKPLGQQNNPMQMLQQPSAKSDASIQLMKTFRNFFKSKKDKGEKKEVDVKELQGPPKRQVHWTLEVSQHGSANAFATDDLGELGAEIGQVSTEPRYPGTIPRWLTNYYAGTKGAKLGFLLCYVIGDAAVNNGIGEIEISNANGGFVDKFATPLGMVKDPNAPKDNYADLAGPAITFRDNAKRVAETKWTGLPPQGSVGMEASGDIVEA